MQISNKNSNELEIPSSDKGLVSVIIPIYNGKNHLKELIKSLINQTYKKIEIIFVDNNSTDNSMQILESFNVKQVIRIFSNNDNV